MNDIILFENPVKIPMIKLLNFDLLKCIKNTYQLVKAEAWKRYYLKFYGCLS